jgi:hypothetical protein
MNYELVFNIFLGMLALLGLTLVIILLAGPLPELP